MPARVSGYVWVQKSALTPKQVGNLKRALTIHPASTSEYDDGPPSPIPIYDETDDEIGLPRAFYAQNASKSDVVLDVAEGIPMRAACIDGGFTGLVDGTPRLEEQSKVVDMLTSFLSSKDWGGCILQAGCGFGKTLSSLRIAHRLGRKTVILVHKEFFLNQWKKSIETFFPGARVGICRQSKCQYKGYDFTIALVQSLTSRDYPQEFYDSFGLVITDEVHRIGAPTWSPIIPRFRARYRIGLTATPRRKDGAEDVFFQHIGDIEYVAESKGMDFVVSRMSIPFELKPARMGRKLVPVHALTSGHIESQIAEDEVTNASIVASIIAAVKNGRKCFVVSTRTEQLWRIDRMLNDWKKAHGADFTIGWVTGSVFDLDENGDRFKVKRKVGKRSKLVWKMRKPSREELDHADTCQVILATKQMIEEGYDNQPIDVVYLAMPISDVEQTVGRGRRPCEPRPDKCQKMCPWRAGVCQGKPTPVIKDVVHTGVSRVERKWEKRACFYRKEGLDIP